MAKTKTKTVSRGTGAALQATYMGEEPVFDPKGNDPSDLQLVKALNWYNVMSTDTKEKSWTIEYVKDFGDAFPEGAARALADMNKREFANIGKYARLVTRGFECDSYIEDLLTKRLEMLIHNAVELGKKSTIEKSAPTISVSERMDQKAEELVSELVGHVDEFFISIKDRKKSEDKNYDFSMNAFVKNNEIKPRLASRMIPLLEWEKNQYNSGTEYFDSEYTESELSRTVRFIDSMLTELNALVESKPKRRRTRKKKTKTPEQLVAKLNYEPEGSIDPKKIIGASKLLVFNTNTNQFMIIEAADSDGLSVKGSTIQNMGKAVMKRIREQYQDELLDAARKQGIRAIKKIYGDIKAKEDTPTGRINKHCVLLRAL